MFNFYRYIRNQMRWSWETFGSGMRTEGLIKHIQKELEEIRKNPTDVTEWIDVIILAIDGAWRCGNDAQSIIDALEKKQLINFDRKWPENPPEDKPSEHKKEEQCIPAL